METAKWLFSPDASRRFETWGGLTGSVVESSQRRAAESRHVSATQHAAYLLKLLPWMLWLFTGLGCAAHQRQAVAQLAGGTRNPLLFLEPSRRLAGVSP